jgi:hypothetical protein
MPVIPEPSNLPILITNALGLAALIGFYFFGVWSRTYIFPTDAAFSIGRQLVAAVPVGFVTMGLYAKSALPPLLQGRDDVAADIAIAIGYAIILGMMSRETLEKLLRAAPAPKPPAL